MNGHTVHLTLRSSNAKTGRIPVSTTSRDSCWTGCAFFGKGCYAENFNLGDLWRAVSRTKPGRTFKWSTGRGRTLTWDAFCAKVAAFKPGQLWRHNQAGDLPGKGGAIDGAALWELVAANAASGARGFTYTHKPPSRANVEHIRKANAAGFTINLSANNLEHADKLAALAAGPVVVVLPEQMQGNIYVDTPMRRRVVVCPATYRDDVTCASCQLCQRRDRSVIVGFPAHGGKRREVSQIAMRGA